SVKRDGGGFLVDLGVGLFAGNAVYRHPTGCDGLAAFAAGQTQPRGQVLVQPHHTGASAVMGAVAPRTAAIRSAGAASIWAPIRPAETRMVGWARQLKSNTVLYCFFIPTGLQPPRT